MSEWISVSSGVLPKAYQRVLITRENFHWANEPVEYVVELVAFSGNVNFIAWMPLPEPYNPEQTLKYADNPATESALASAT